MSGATFPVRLRGAGAALLRAYAQVIFSRHPLAGALLLGATSLAPAVALHGAVAAALAMLLARLAGLDREGAPPGDWGTNALLVGLGLGATLQPTPTALVLLGLAALLTLLVTAGLRSALLAFDLPVLTLPFLCVFPLALGAATRLALARLPPAPPSPALGLSDGPAAGLEALGALFFIPRADAGALVLAALLVHSRVGTLLACEGLLVASALSRLAPDGATGLWSALGYNLALLALAAGGVWFVPGPGSFLLAAAAALAGGLVTIGALPLLEWLALPLLVIPFNLVLLLLLLGARQRSPGTHPVPAPLLGATPEESLAAQRNRVARLGASYPVRLGAPFLGRWTCTQGSRGALTHREAWTHAADFEVHDASGRAHRGTGRRREDYLCWHLPVVAPADGTVVVVRDGVPDNEPGSTNLRENWGNLVVLHHAPGLYSLLAHLSCRSIGVREGQRVRRGEQLGLCGSSGRSPVPHLHLQLQATPVPGAPTSPLELHDVVVGAGEGESLRGVLVPETGQVIRGLVATADMEHRLCFAEDSPLRFRVVDGAGHAREETLRSEVDLRGVRRLISDRGASLELEVEAALFTALEVRGPGPGVLDLLQAALPRVPLEADPRLCWEGLLSWRAEHPLPVRWLRDAASPFLPDRRPRLRYSLEASGPDLVVRGESAPTAAGGVRLARTRCVLRNGLGPVEVELELEGRRWSATRVATDVPATGPQPEPAGPVLR